MSLHRLPRLFALIVGINEYDSPNIKNLVGAVPDADSMRGYLLEHLGVPSSQIRDLRNSEATRATIIKEILAFSLNDEIKEGDPILIYYAGHGHSANTPEGWVGCTDGKIELLVPYDYSSLKDGNPKHGIPDRTLGALLSYLANKKGNNIVRQTSILRAFIYQLTIVHDRLSSSIVVTPALAHEIFWITPSRLELSMTKSQDPERFLLTLIKIFGVSMRIQNAQQKSILAFLARVLGPTSFWQHVAPRS